MKVPISDHALVSLDAPVLPAYSFRSAGRNQRWLVWCKWCRHWHAHGPMEGHREAHCSERTPYRSTGYNLAFRGRWQDYFPGETPELS
jgi:hypothetical protein